MVCGTGIVVFGLPVFSRGIKAPSLGLALLLAEMVVDVPVFVRPGLLQLGGRGVQDWSGPVLAPRGLLCSRSAEA